MVRYVLALVLSSSIAFADADRDRAVDLTIESAKRYEQGRFAESIRLLEEAYAIEPDPIILYNLARAYEATGDVQRAIDAYRGYLAGKPAAENRAGVEQRVVTLERLLAERRLLQRERDEARRRQSSRSRSRTPWIIAGIGAGVVGIGALIGVAAREKHEEAVTAPTGTATAEANTASSRLSLVANACFALGGGAIVGGVAWGVLGFRDDDRGSGAVVGIAGRF